jgi:PAS domain-containing protein
VHLDVKSSLVELAPSRSRSKSIGSVKEALSFGAGTVVVWSHEAACHLIVRLSQSVLPPATPTRGRDHDVDGWIAVVTDVTERHLDQDALRASEVQLKDAQRLAQVGSWEHHVEEDRIYRSDEMLRILGKPDIPPFTSAASLNYVHPKDRDKILEAIHKIRSTIAPVDVTA